jgi:virginiamycin A acetyltransferase
MLFRGLKNVYWRYLRFESVNGMSILSKLLYELYIFRQKKLRDIMLRAVARIEGGEMRSPTLRRIFLDYHQIEIGLYSYGGCFDLGRVTAHTKIGRYCSFAEGVCIFNRNHPVDFRSTHPYFFNTKLGYVKDEFVPMRQIVIGNDVWVGRNALILPSVKKIGDGAVIGAGSVVTKDVPDFAVVAGNPANIIKYRFSEETRREIKDSQWWNKDTEELQNNLGEFSRPLEKEVGK